eukprot:33441-Amphidinium_carterae.1
MIRDLALLGSRGHGLAHFLESQKQRVTTMLASRVENQVIHILARRHFLDAGLSKHPREKAV